MHMRPMPRIRCSCHTCRGNDDKENKAAVRRQRRDARSKDTNQGDAEKAGMLLSVPLHKLSLTLFCRIWHSHLAAAFARSVMLAI